VSRILIDGGLVVFWSTAKGKGNIYPRTGYEGTEAETMCNSTLPSNLALDGGGGCVQHHAPAALPAGKARYPLYWSLDGPQDRSGRVR